MSEKLKVIAICGSMRRSGDREQNRKKVLKESGKQVWKTLRTHVFYFNFIQNSLG